MTVSSNVALQKLVTMSTQYRNAPGSNAVDGRKGGNWYIDGCASTINKSNPWILVDLEQEYTISSIYITNRQDGNLCKD